MLTNIGRDISPDFKPNAFDSQFCAKIIKHEGKPSAIRRFAADHYGVSDYMYWFMLGTLWVSYTGWSDLNLWRRLFQADRPNRDTSLMKPSELGAFRQLPDVIPCLRAHRDGETDWMSYTLSMERAVMFARQRNATRVSQYLLPKDKAMCLFLRRGEFEILAMNPSDATRVADVKVVVEAAQTTEVA